MSDDTDNSTSRQHEQLITPLFELTLDSYHKFSHSMNESLYFSEYTIPSSEENSIYIEQQPTPNQRLLNIIRDIRAQRRGVHVFQAFIYNNGYERGLGMNYLERLFSEDGNLPHDNYNLLEQSMLSDLFNEEQYNQGNIIHIDNKEKVSQDFIGRLQRFEAFIQANMVIYEDQFQLFLHEGGALIHEYPILTPLAQDILWVGQRLRSNIQQEHARLLGQIYNEDSGNGDSSTLDTTSETEFEPNSTVDSHPSFNTDPNTSSDLDTNTDSESNTTDHSFNPDLNTGWGSNFYRL